MKRVSTLILIMMFISILAVPAFAATEGSQYILDDEMKRIPIPSAYIADKSIIYFSPLVGAMKQPADLFIDSKGIMYIADTGNNRIIKCTKEGKFIKIFKGPDKPFNEPHGVYVDADGDIYVADTKNARVVHMSPEGRLVEVFNQPTSPLYDVKYPFTPAKIYIDSIGQIYVLNLDDYHGFVVLKSNNEFKGYIASTKLSFNIMDRITRLLASKEQRDRIDKQLPPTHSNFIIDSFGTLYTTTIRTKVSQVNRFTPVGRNIFPKKGFFGEVVADYMMMFVGKTYNDPQFADLTVDENGILSALDGTSGRIYQYDQDGNLLAVFGGTGSWKGKFMNASSIAGDNEGNLYVLDSDQGRIQIFKPTSFINNVHKALAIYHDGRYEEALQPWNQILRIDKNYPIAHIGIAKALLKEGKTIESMQSYLFAEDKAGYSDAFVEYRHDIFRQYFLLIVILAFALIVLISLAVKKALALKKKAWIISSRQQKVSGFINSASILTNPFDGFVILKRNRYLGGLDYKTPIILIVLTVVSKIVSIYITHYPLALVIPAKANLLVETGSLLIPFFTLSCCCYLITSIVKGESTFAEQILSSAYCLLPYIIFTIPIALLSRIMSIADLSIYQSINTIIWIWVILIALVNLSVMNNYGFWETLKVAALSIFAAIFIWSIIALMYILGSQMVGFAQEIYREFTINYLL